MDVFNRLLDADEEVVHKGANVDFSALHALIEEVRGCGAADARGGPFKYLTVKHRSNSCDSG